MSEAKYETIYWGTLEIRFKPHVYERAALENAIKVADGIYPDATAKVPAEVFMGIFKNGEVDVAVMGVTGQPPLFVSNESPSQTLEDLLKKVGDTLKNSPGFPAMLKIWKRHKPV